MEKKKEKDRKKKIVIAVVAMVAIAALYWVATLLVANFNILDMLKSLHGG